MLLQRLAGLLLLGLPAGAGRQLLQVTGVPVTVQVGLPAARKEGSSSSKQVNRPTDEVCLCLCIMDLPAQPGCRLVQKTHRTLHKCLMGLLLLRSPAEEGAELWQVRERCRGAQLIRLCWPVYAAALARLSIWLSCCSCSWDI